jgi:hypothetical protein
MRAHPGLRKDGVCGALTQNLEGEFSGLALLAYMHVGFRMFDAKGDAGTGLDREYEAAVKMRRER